MINGHQVQGPNIGPLKINERKFMLTVNNNLSTING